MRTGVHQGPESHCKSNQPAWQTSATQPTCCLKPTLVATGSGSSLYTSSPLRCSSAHGVLVPRPSGNNQTKAVTCYKQSTAAKCAVHITRPALAAAPLRAGRPPPLLLPLMARRPRRCLAAWALPLAAPQRSPQARHDQCCAAATPAPPAPARPRRQGRKVSLQIKS